MPEFFARIDNGVVAEVIALPGGWTLEETFTPELVETMKRCPPETTQGQVFNKDGSFSPAPSPQTDE